MASFAETAQCRMTALIQHFGDTTDGNRPCGHCDFCSPERATAQTFRQPSGQEERQLRSILRALDGGQSRATGKLHTDLALGIDRKQFDAYLNALTRAGLVALTSDSFTNAEGNLISFKRASLTHEGRTLDDGEDLGVLLPAEDTSTSPARKRSRSTSSHSSSSSRSSSGVSSRRQLSGSSDVSSRPKRSEVEGPASQPLTPRQQQLEKALRDWRKAEAAKTGKPAFLVFGDTVLHNIVRAHPSTLVELQSVSGIGPEKSDLYGAQIISLCRKAKDSSSNTELPVSSTNSPVKAHPQRRASLPVKMPAPQADQELRDRGHRHSSESQPAVQTFTRPRVAVEPADPLTPIQQALDQRLREWRSSEAERLGLPQFFILGTSTLRAIAVEHPRTLADLKHIEGISLEKVERFGASILEICAG
jgi:ATP-dependent DNA helicase RecQ